MYSPLKKNVNLLTHVGAFQEEGNLWTSDIVLDVWVALWMLSSSRIMNAMTRADLPRESVAFGSAPEVIKSTLDLKSQILISISEIIQARRVLVHYIKLYDQP